MKNVILSLMLLSLAACGGPLETTAVGSANAASADAEITVELIEGDNRAVTLLIKNLPPADRIAPGLTSYVMWFVPAKQAPLKASILKYDPDTRLGEAFATTPHGKFEIRVTAEKTGQVTTPSNHIAVTKSISY